jgi:hypothetical protein
MQQTIFHPNFLSDPTEYALSKRYWQELFRSITHEAGVSDSWRDPWLNMTFVDGTSFADGNPIFSALSPNRKLGVRIIQLDPANPGEDPSWSSWIGVFGDGDEAIRELVISCVLSDESAMQASNHLRLWVTDGASNGAHSSS